MQTYMDEVLTKYETVWAAAGAPETVFEIAPHALLTATQAVLFNNG